MSVCQQRVVTVFCLMIGAQAKGQKTYNRRDSQMVTHSSTSRPVQCLCMAERTGCPVFTDLWSYVLIVFDATIMYCVPKKKNH
jgi:hypothetical protein